MISAVHLSKIAKNDNIMRWVGLRNLGEFPNLFIDEHQDSLLG